MSNVARVRAEWPDSHSDWWGVRRALVERSWGAAGHA